MKRLILAIILPTLTLIAQSEASEKKTAPITQQLNLFRAAVQDVRKQERTRTQLLYEIKDPSRNVTRRNFTPNTDQSLLEQLKETQQRCSHLKRENAALAINARQVAAERKLQKAATAARELKKTTAMQKELADLVAEIHQEQLSESNGAPVIFYTPNPELSLSQQLEAAHRYSPVVESIIKAIDELMVQHDKEEAARKSAQTARPEEDLGITIFHALTGNRHNEEKRA